MLVALTLIHVLISLVGIATGLVVAVDFLGSRVQKGWTDVFLYTTIATSVTGFLFPVDRILPAHVIGVISLVVLAVAVKARARMMADGGMRRTYVWTSLVALYLNVFVLWVQMFQKIEPLRAAAPTQSEPPFALVQGLTALLFLWVGYQSFGRFRPVGGKI